MICRKIKIQVKEKLEKRKKIQIMKKKKFEKFSKLLKKN